jgi:hypothetical protein
VTDRVRHHYRISVAGRAIRPLSDLPFVLRHPNPDDRDMLAELMLDAYRGTIEDEGWSSVDAFVTVGNTQSERLFAGAGAELVGSDSTAG